MRLLALLLGTWVGASLTCNVLEYLDEARDNWTPKPYQRPGLTARLRSAQDAHHERVMRLIREAR